jgi:hypothetical protein
VETRRPLGSRRQTFSIQSVAATAAISGEARRRASKEAPAAENERPRGRDGRYCRGQGCRHPGGSGGGGRENYCRHQGGCGSKNPREFRRQYEQQWPIECDHAKEVDKVSPGIDITARRCDAPIAVSC